MGEKTMYVAAALAAGAVLPLQALINARLAGGVGSSAFAAMISVGVGTLSLLLYVAATRQTFPPLSSMAALPWWIWAGGLLGAFYVASAAYTAPVLGAASLIALVVLGQMVASLLLDHYGVLAAARPITLARVIGAVLLIAGVWLITRPSTPSGGGMG